MLAKRSRTPNSKAGSFRAVLRQRCPECGNGIAFRRGMKMNRLCPSCGVRFEREPGYFTGAIYIGIIIAFPITLLFLLGLFYLFRDIHPALAGFLAMLFFLPLVPVTIRVSRMMWMNLERGINPSAQNDNGPPDADQPGSSTPPSNPGGEQAIRDEPEVKKSCDVLMTPEERQVSETQLRGVH